MSVYHFHQNDLNRHADVLQRLVAVLEYNGSFLFARLERSHRAANDSLPTLDFSVMLTQSREVFAFPCGMISRFNLCAGLSIRRNLSSVY